MLDDIKKGFFAGIGAILLTRDKVEEVTERLVKESKLSREEARKLADDLAQSGEKQWSDLESRVVDTVRKGIGTLDIGRKSEIEELRRRVDNLEKRLAMMEEPPIPPGAD